MGKSMAVRNLNWRSHQILENIFLTCGVIKWLGMHAQSISHPLLPFSSPILPHVGFLHVAEASYVFILHVGSHSPHFCMPKNPFLCCSVSGKGRFTLLLHFHGVVHGWEPFLPCWVAKNLDSWFLELLGIFIIIIHPRWGSLKQLRISYVWNTFLGCYVCVFPSRG